MVDSIDGRSDVMIVRASRGSASLELVPMEDGSARCYLRPSPRNLRLTVPEASGAAASLAGRGPSPLLFQDTRGGFLAGVLGSHGWKVGKALAPSPVNRCNIVSPHDLPLDEELVDEHGAPLNLDGTSHMTGIHVDIDGRDAWAFYTDEGETARASSDGGRRHGFAVARTQEETDLALDDLVGFLVSARKRWAVFSMDMLPRLSRFRPAVTHRMELEGPGRHPHTIRPLSKDDRRMAVDLFSEYYDEGRLSASLRLRRYVRDGSFSVSVAEGAFVIVRLDGDQGLVFDIYVRPDRQGEGVGDELMRCALDTLSGRVGKVYLHTSYPRAKRLYGKHGFRVVSSNAVIRLDETAATPPPST